jgi:hypothetical protein
MLQVPSYPKVITIGTYGTENFLKGEVRVDEKIDGSQFGFGVYHGEIGFRSHGQLINPACPPNMFKSVVDYLLSKREYLVDTFCHHPVYFYGEVVTKRKQNVLEYAQPAMGGLVLFDMVSDMGWEMPEALAFYAEQLGISYAPPLFMGRLTFEELNAMLTALDHATSFLGGAVPEGLVVKNYNQFFEVAGKVIPLFVKLVRPQFKERHAEAWGIKGGPGELEKFINSFRNDEARWQKAVQTLQERGALKGAVQDIGELCAITQDDVEAEEKEAIMQGLWRLYGKDFKRATVAGLAEWYKKKLMEEVANVE